MTFKEFLDINEYVNHKIDVRITDPKRSYPVSVAAEEHLYSSIVCSKGNVPWYDYEIDRIWPRQTDTIIVLKGKEEKADVSRPHS